MEIHLHLSFHLSQHHQHQNRAGHLMGTQQISAEWPDDSVPQLFNHSVSFAGFTEEKSGESYLPFEWMKGCSLKPFPQVPAPEEELGTVGLISGMFSHCLLRTIDSHSKARPCAQANTQYHMLDMAALADSETPPPQK